MANDRVGYTVLIGRKFLGELGPIEYIVSSKEELVTLVYECLRDGFPWATWLELRYEFSLIGTPSVN